MVFESRNEGIYAATCTIPMSSRKPGLLKYRSSGGRQHGSQPAIDCEDLPSNVFAGVAGEENSGAFQIVLVADATQRNAGGKLFDTDSLDCALRHFRREESGRQGIGRNSIAAPTPRQRPREVDHRSLAR